MGSAKATCLHNHGFCEINVRFNNRVFCDFRLRQRENGEMQILALRILVLPTRVVDGVVRLVNQLSDGDEAIASVLQG